MKPWLLLGIGVGSLWLQLAVASYGTFFGLKPNVMLLVLLLIALRRQEPWLFLYAAPAGLALDVFSHGMVGVYGISFFLVSLLASYAAKAVYEHNIWFTVGGVAGLSLAEGLISSTIFEILDPTTPWWSWFLNRVIPLAIFHGLLAPFLLYGFVQIGRLGKLAVSYRRRK